MLTTKEIRGVKVCKPAKPGKEFTKDGVPRHKKKIGKVFKTVFSPDGLRVVGFIVRQPDLLWMIKRPEKFLALDAFDIVDDVLVPTMGGDSWDDRAIKRLGVDYDTCILWEGIEVHDPSGSNIGHVDEISFDERTGEVESFLLDDGGAARALLGSIEIPADLVIGYRKGYLIVEADAARLNPAGGLAAKAGAATAKAGIEAREGAKKAGEAAGKAVEKGEEGLGKLIGRTKNMVSDTRDEFRKSSGAAQKDAAKAKATPSAKSAGSGAKTAGAASAAGAAAKTSTAKAASGKASSSAPSSKTSTASKSSSKTATSSKATSSKKSATEAVSDHMKSAGSMFSDFKKEFDKAKKD